NNFLIIFDLRIVLNSNVTKFNLGNCIICATRARQRIREDSRRLAILRIWIRRTRGMGKKLSTFIAIGGGEIAEVKDVMDYIANAADTTKSSRMLIMTVATEDADKASAKYDRLFRKNGFAHID